MNIKESISILENYQCWRTGEDDVQMPTTSEVTEALNVVINHFKNGDTKHL